MNCSLKTAQPVKLSPLQTTQPPEALSSRIQTAKDEHSQPECKLEHPPQLNFFISLTGDHHDPSFNYI